MIHAIVADETLLDRKKLKSLLEEIGISVLSDSGNAVHVFNEFRIYKPELVFLGLSLSNLDSSACMRRIRDSGGDAQIIIVGNANERREIFEALEAGADEYLLKPFDLQQVEKVVYKLLKHSVTGVHL